MSVAAAALSSGSTLVQEPIRVMVVDDAVVVRGSIMRWVDAEPDMHVVASVRGGREAIEQVERRSPDVVILDVTMPDMDGITALPLLLEKKPDLVVLMSSTLTRRNAEISLHALSLGAADYIPKPESSRDLTTKSAFRRELIDKIRALGSRRKGGLTRPRIVPAPVAAGPAPAPVPARVPAAGYAEQRALEDHYEPGDAASLAPSIPDPDKVLLRPFPMTTPRVLLIGASTGGPQALNAILATIGSVIDQVPVLITQHMPPTFTSILAEHLTRTSGRPATEANDGEPIRAGHIYVARGGRHMRVVRRDGEATIALDDGPMINFCKPAVDPLFSSASAIWGSWLLGLVLTGMGSDGLRGAGDIVAAGGGIIAQDEPSSVVWGMPGQVAHAGLASAVLPPDQIAAKLIRIFSGARP
jgi:two-component system, chemotaxis family, protein-glutamate methylesterase/glutaminase